MFEGLQRRDIVSPEREWKNEQKLISEDKAKLPPATSEPSNEDSLELKSVQPVIAGQKQHGSIKLGQRLDQMSA